MAARVADRTLLERLARTMPGQPTARHDVSAEIESVLSNLRHIFNARQGCSSARPDFGMPDLTDVVFSFPVAIPEVTRVIRTLVEEFEPRLRNVQVRHNTDGADLQSVRFHIRGEVSTGEGRAPVILDGSMTGDGHIEIRS